MPLLINGEEKALLTGFALFGLVSLAIFFAESAEFVIAIRFLLGIAGALIMPTTLSMIRVIFENPKERATALAVWSIASSIGAVFGPIIGGALLEQFSWHSAFLINVPFAIIAVVAGLFYYQSLSYQKKSLTRGYSFYNFINCRHDWTGMEYQRIFKRRTSRYYSMGCNSISNYHDSDIC